MDRPHRLKRLLTMKKMDDILTTQQNKQQDKKFAPGQVKI